MPQRAPALSLAMATTIVAELAARASASRPIQDFAWAAMGCVIVLSWRAIRIREAYLLALSLGLATLLLLTSEHPETALRAALDQASFLMVFVLLLGLLHEAAASSPSIAGVGDFLTRQPPGRRYYALYAGTAGLAVLFNIGVVSFLVPLIEKGIERATPGDPLNPIRERRQISALLRGFAWSVVWSPTAIAPLAVAELIDGTDRHLWMLYGFQLFLVVMVVGALEDRWRFRHYRPSAPIAVVAFPTAAVLRFVAACGWLFGMTGIVVWLTGDSVIFGLLMASPVMVAGWLAAQHGFPDRAALPRTAARLRAIVSDNLPGSAAVAITLACSGFIGRAAAALVPAAELAQWLRLDALPDFVLLGLIPIMIAALSLLALSPIMMAVFFGSLFGALPVLPAEPTLVAFSISCGWALSMTFSPFATVVLLVARASGQPAARMTLVWNIGFTLLSAALLFPVFALLTGGR